MSAADPNLRGRCAATRPENRERLLAAASQVFAEHGLDAGVEEVARAAGVGMGTLYRRFPTKQALIDELVGGMRRELRELAQAAGHATDGTGLENLLLRAGELQADPGGCLRRLWAESDAEQAMRRAISRPSCCSSRRPKAAVGCGRTSAATTSRWCSGRCAASSRPPARTRTDAWRRHLDLLLAGMRVGAGPALEHPPMTQAQSRRISARR